MHIRKATLDDIAQIIGIYNETFVDTLRNPMKYYRKYIQKDNVFVLSNDVLVCGAYVFEINRMENIHGKGISKQRFLWLRQVMVEPKHQGNGFGGQLMLDYMMKADMQKRLICEPKLVNWYKRFGFIDYQRFEYRKKRMHLMIKD